MTSSNVLSYGEAADAKLDVQQQTIASKRRATRCGHAGSRFGATARPPLTSLLPASGEKVPKADEGQLWMSLCDSRQERPLTPTLSPSMEPMGRGGRTAPSIPPAKGEGLSRGVPPSAVK